MKNCYEVFGLEKGLDKQNYFERYDELKRKYSEDMFLAGEEGNNAAKKLTELESAWTRLSAEIDKQKINEQLGSDYGHLEELIKAERSDEAQRELDSMMARSAEWHYYQSMVFYQREWMSESRKHLVIAVQMEPNNPKYKESLAKLDLKMANSQIPPEQFGNPQAHGEERMCDNNFLANCCLIYCCLDCCCSMAQCL